MIIEKENTTKVKTFIFYFITFIEKVASKTIMIAAID